MKESAVEWYTKQILEYKSPTNINGTDYILIPVNKVDFLQEQAKEIDKQAHQETWDGAHQAGILEGKGIAEENWWTFEEYWEENFKQQEQ
jgi:hypothetical protein